MDQKRVGALQLRSKSTLVFLRVQNNCFCSREQGADKLPDLLHRCQLRVRVQLQTGGLTAHSAGRSDEDSASVQSPGSQAHPPSQDQPT